MSKSSKGPVPIVAAEIFVLEDRSQLSILTSVEGRLVQRGYYPVDPEPNIPEEELKDRLQAAIHRAVIEVLSMTRRHGKSNDDPGKKA